EVAKPAPPKPSSTNEKSFSVPDQHDVSQFSSDKVFVDENFSSNDEIEYNFTLKPVNWGGITTPAHKEKPQSKAPRPRCIRSMNLSSVKGGLKLTKEQDAILCKASKAFHNAQKTLQDVKDNLGLLNEFKDQSERINVKIDLEENGVAHLSGSQAPRHHDWDTSNQLVSPDSQHGPELIDGHCGREIPSDDNKKSDSTGVAPAKPISHKQIKREIK
ncbi:hypothetical protein DXG01_005354, partial [Tephrocybe rancida]